ncbi:hypothetical protein [Paracoccus sp. 22332]|uniref:hypothetical protein n=1 Tax=Paracoccus sp. 22332 TaxID=3453913 RepID=UPI003F874C3B
MSDIADLMRRVPKPAPARHARPARPKAEYGDMHPAHRANAIRKAEREGDTVRLAQLQAATPKE